MKKRKKINVERIVANKNKRRGRSVEKRVADYLGFDAKGLYGGEDAKLGIFSAEVKDRKKYAGATMFKQAETNCKKAKRKIPILVVHTTNGRIEDSLVHMKAKDWMDLFTFAMEKGYVKKNRS